jgi:hypothetical protein
MAGAPFSRLSPRGILRIVFGRVLFWLIVFVAVTYLYKLGKQYIIINSAIVEQNTAIDYKDAWQYLYQHKNKM